LDLLHDDAKDNPEMEGFNSRFKSEGNSLFLDTQSIAELAKIVDQRMRYCNANRLHSSIGYLSPMNFIRQTAMNSSSSEVHI
jgi:transposase InsO family protein